LADCVCCPRQCHTDRRQPDSPQPTAALGGWRW
jgi:hypothetical protein